MHCARKNRINSTKPDAIQKLARKRNRSLFIKINFSSFARVSKKIHSSQTTSVLSNDDTECRVQNRENSPDTIYELMENEGGRGNINQGRWDSAGGCLSEIHLISGYPKRLIIGGYKLRFHGGQTGRITADWLWKSGRVCSRISYDSTGGLYFIITAIG